MKLLSAKWSRRRLGDIQAKVMCWPSTPDLNHQDPFNHRHGSQRTANTLGLTQAYLMAAFIRHVTVSS